jgi:hypothetical protein
LNTPINEITNEYIELITKLAEFDKLDSLSENIIASIETTKRSLASVCEKLKIKGYPEASDINLTSGRQRIIPRILSIKLGIGVGYKLNSTMEVMNAIKQSSSKNCSNHTIYMIAEKVFRRDQNVVNPDWYTNWVNDVKASIRAGESTYVHNHKLDKILSILFPEMKEVLAKEYIHKSAVDSKVEIYNPSINLDRAKVIEKFKDDYPSSYYKLLKLRINFRLLLGELNIIKNGEDYGKYFYKLSRKYFGADFSDIVKLMHAAGFNDAISQWDEYQKLRRNSAGSFPNFLNQPSMRSETEPQFGIRELPALIKAIPNYSYNRYLDSNRASNVEVNSTKPNLYAEMKGRDKPRKNPP